MQELDVIAIINPTKEDFSWRYNGQAYTVKAGENRSFSLAVAYHLAKHLSTKMVCDEAKKSVKPSEIANPKSSIHIKVSQLNTYDTHERRIALYKILGDEKLVIDVISRYPFKGFIGEMSEYQTFVEKEKSKVGQVAEK